jgi:hypothetical protein
MKLLLLSILLIFAVNISINAQQLNSVVLDQATKTPVDYATVSSKAGNTFTTTTGSFTLINVAFNDTITITHMGYKPYRLISGMQSIPATIYLQKDSILLKEVSVKSRRDYKKDLLSNRRQFSQVFAYKAPGWKEIFIMKSPYVQSTRPNNTSELVSINVLQLIGFLAKSKNPTSRLKKVLLKGEEDTYVDQIFSKDRITGITALKGDSLQKFMLQYRPAVGQAISMSDYDMLLYIKKSYADFKKS